MATVLANTSVDCLNLSEWQEYVEAQPVSIAFHHRRWIELLMEQYRFPLTILAVKECGEVMAAVPFLETRKPWGSKKLISLPFTDCIRVLAKDERSRGLMLDAIRCQKFDAYRAVVLRTDRPLAGVVGQAERVRHQIVLERPSVFFDRYPANVRRNLRKAQQAGLRFHARTDADAMETFYRLHLLTRRKHGVPIQPRSYFARLHEKMVRTGLGFVGLVSKEETAIAASVYFIYNRTMIYKYGASNPDALACRPNEFMMHNALHMAAEEGFTNFDFGMSRRRDEGLCRFKEKWGACEAELHYEYLFGEPPESDDESLAERIMIHTIRRSPTLLCRAVGEVLYRYSQ